MMSTALKELAVENHIHITSSTQVNANSDKQDSDIRNEGSIAGARAIINKADIGCIMARPTNEELEWITSTVHPSFVPNLVTDVYKVRSGQYSQVRIWSFVDLGTGRKEDLFVTNSRKETVPDFDTLYFNTWEDRPVEIIEFCKYINNMKASL